MQNTTGQGNSSGLNLSNRSGNDMDVSLLPGTGRSVSMNSTTYALGLIVGLGAMAGIARFAFPDAFHGAKVPAADKTSINLKAATQIAPPAGMYTSPLSNAVGPARK